MPSDTIPLEAAGREMHGLISELFPICRSITGPGVRQTLDRLRNHIPLEVHEVPTGTKVFDWEVPQEWQIRDAYIKDSRGARVVDFRASNLHVVSGSAAVSATMRWQQLKHHLHTLPEHPDWIPYRTCFHQAGWGFCLTQNQFDRLDAQGDRPYEVCIDATLDDGWLTYGELFLPGATDEEVLFSCHVCHPSLANDNLAGIAVATELAKYLSGLPRRYGYRFLFIPATIGAITWLSRNEHRLTRIRHGLVLTLLGDPGCSTYKQTRRGDAPIDRVVTHVLQHSGRDHAISQFEPFGYDERQFCSPGINLPVGCFMRTPNEQYPEYHTSADDLNLVQPRFLADSLAKLRDVVDILEGDRTYVNLRPKCEPRLGKRGLYRAFGCEADQVRAQRAVLWVLNLADGTRSLLEIAERAGLEFKVIQRAANVLVEHKLLAECLARTGVPQTAAKHVSNTPVPEPVGRSIRPQFLFTKDLIQSTERDTP